MTNSRLGFETLAGELCRFLRTSVVDESVGFDENTPLDRIGLDSVSIVEMLLFIERRFGIEIPDSCLTHKNLESVASLARCALDLPETVS